MNIKLWGLHEFDIVYSVLGLQFSMHWIDCTESWCIRINDMNSSICIEGLKVNTLTSLKYTSRTIRDFVNIYEPVYNVAKLDNETYMWNILNCKLD